jgi:hypothetical protein
MSSEQDYGFVCECGGEVEEIWEKITARRGSGKYRCTECNDTGMWTCKPNSPEQTGLMGCLVRRAEASS